MKRKDKLFMKSDLAADWIVKIIFDRRKLDISSHYQIIHLETYGH